MTQLRFLLAIAAAALGACATQAPVQNAAELRRTHGYVVAALPPLVDAQPLTVTLRSVPDGRELRLGPVAGRGLAQWVPAGSYEIAEMVGRDRGSYLPIQVTAGGALDLGGLAWANVGAGQRVLLPLRHPELAERSAAVIEQAKEHLTAGTAEWNPTVAPKPQDQPIAETNLGLVGVMINMAVEKANQAPLRARLREAIGLKEFTALYASSAAPLIGDSVADAQGNLYVGSNLGQLRRRDAQGRWSAIDTGTIAPVTAVHADGQAIVVGTLDGRLRGSTDGGRTWTALHRFGDQEPVLGIHARAGRYLVLTGQMSEAGNAQAEMLAATVYEAGALPAPRVNLIRRFDFPARIPAFSVPAVRAVVAGRYYHVNRFNAVERLDLADGTWKTVQLPHDVSHLRASSDGKVLTAFKAQGAFSKLSISGDDGATWLPLDTPPYPVQDVRMDTQTSGAGSRWELGMLSTALQLVSYDPASRTWIKGWTASPATCARTVRDGSGAERFCVSGGGSILRITPEGLVPELLAN